MQIPTPERQWKQPNDGTGNVFASYNVDLTDTKKKLRVSEPIIKAISSADDAQLAGYVAAFAEYGGSLYAISDYLFRTSDGANPTSGWAEVASVDSTGNTITDMVVFDGLLLFSQGNDIKSYNGSTDADWWTTTLGQSALTTGDDHIMEVGPDGNLYIVDEGNKIYRVTPASVVTKTGAGTLDFSARPLTITCMESNSSRLWVGFTAEDGNSTFIAEWDMGPQSISPNRIHPIPAKTVLCIAIWNDTPVAVLSTGKIMYFNGSGFVEWKSAQFPLYGDNIDQSFMHFNGWAIIDGLPHFLVGSEVGTAASANAVTNNKWYLSAGAWCLDPDIGLYHRYAIGAGTSTKFDYGQPMISNTGALYATESRTTKFLASYEYVNAAGTTITTIGYHDRAKSQAAKGWLASEWFEVMDAQTWGQLKTIFKKLSSGEAINTYYRFEEEDSVILSGTWATTTTFHTTDTTTAIETGDIAFIKRGPGAGRLAKITKTTSSGTTVITLDVTVSEAAAGNAGYIEVLPFKRLKQFTNTQRDWDTVAFPTSTKHRKLQVLVELEQNSASTVELDYVIIE